MQDTTGIVYATSFPALDAAIAEVSKYFASQASANRADAGVHALLSSLRSKLEALSGPMSGDSLAALKALENLLIEVEKLGQLSLSPAAEEKVSRYEFDRKFLFKMLVLGNAQLAQIIKVSSDTLEYSRHVCTDNRQ